MAGLTKKGKTYYALFSERGKTKWVKIGKVSFKDAKEHLRKLESQYFTEFNALFNTSLIGIVTDIKVTDLNIDKMYANIDC
jgi:hypothetical protein